MLVIMKLIFMASMSLVLSVILFFAGSVISKKPNFSQAYLSPFECGFSPLETSKVIFSSRFFVMALVFMIFDIELILLFPYLCLNQMSSYLPFFLMLFFINILSFGLYYEWNFSMMDWIY